MTWYRVSFHMLICNPHIHSCIFSLPYSSPLCTNLLFHALPLQIIMHLLLDQLLWLPFTTAMPHFLLVPLHFSCILIGLIYTLTNIPITWHSSSLSPKPLFTVLPGNSPCLSNVPGVCFCSCWHLVGNIWQILWPIIKSKFYSKALRFLLNCPPPAFSALYMSLTLSLVFPNPWPSLLLDFCSYHSVPSEMFFLCY